MARRDDGCFEWIVFVLLLLIALVWLLQNHPAWLWGAICTVVIFSVLKSIFRITKRRKREKNYQEIVATQIQTWKSWEKDGIPSQKIEKVFLDEDEEGLFSAPYNLRVGNANRTNQGTLSITSKQIIFSSNTVTKRAFFKDVFSTNYEDSRLFLILKKSDKNLCVWPNEPSEEATRISMAEAFFIISYCLGKNYVDIEHEILQILGVKKAEI